MDKTGIGSTSSTSSMSSIKYVLFRCPDAICTCFVHPFKPKTVCYFVMTSSESTGSLFLYHLSPLHDVDTLLHRVAADAIEGIEAMTSG